MRINVARSYPFAKMAHKAREKYKSKRKIKLQNLFTYTSRSELSNMSDFLMYFVGLVFGAGRAYSKCIPRSVCLRRRLDSNRSFNLRAIKRLC